MLTRVMVVYEAAPGATLTLPLFAARVAAGFPSPADNHMEGKLDLNEHLVRHPAATFFVRAAGDSMTGAGIHSGDLLVVDRAVEPADGHVVIAVVDGDLTVKRIRKANGKVFLAPDNPNYPPLRVGDETQVEVWGVVTNVIHPV